MRILLYPLLVFFATVSTRTVDGSYGRTPQVPAHKHTNRLAGESSPYLLQHAHNPVDWYPWGEDAFAKARKENKPVFLSVGYAACHWCHVMERQSFENEEIAKVLNAGFVSIKVDREERPDVDDVYMTAVQLLTQRGGWPMSVWLTPDGKPFYGGTYYPPEDFTRLLNAVSEAWKTRRADVDKSADSIADAIRRRSAAEPGSFKLPTRSAAKEVMSELQGSYDKQYGGFGRAPKFPPHSTFQILFYFHDHDQNKEALSLALGTLDAMARGGIRDHLGGGFHRYSTDAKWLVPHFEKMLYDNALLARAYAEAYRITGKPPYREVATEILDWALLEIRGPEGGFYSSLDADSEGEEGKYYLWTRKEVIETLGPAEGELFCRAFDVQETGNHEEQLTGKKNGKNILHLAASAQPLPRLAEMRSRLIAVRNKRHRPGLDDKRLTAWNGLMIGALARCGQILKEPRYTQAAEKAADFVLTTQWRAGKLIRSFRPTPGGEKGGRGEEETRVAGGPSTITRTSMSVKPAFLDDYSYLIAALLDLHAATGSAQRLKQAKQIADEMIARFSDPAGGFYETPADGEKLLVRGKNAFDGATPSANGVASRALLRLHVLTKDAKYRAAAVGTLKSLGGYVERAPRAAETLVLAAMEMGDMDKTKPAVKTRK